jgi:hypothetical protein
MFASVHGYHPELSWENASIAHRELYLKLAKEAVDALERWETEGGAHERGRDESDRLGG